jgi:DNA helicase-2/ATP-dependent DNA helicase PcrA
MKTPVPSPCLNADQLTLLEEEELLLKRVQQGLFQQSAEEASVNVYQDLIELRDSIGEARTEDVPAIMAQMEQLALISQQQGQMRRTAIPDPANPYFAHLRLQEGRRTRDLLIGSRNGLSPHLPCPIVDWKTAPISAIFYRYREGDEYFEEIGGREMEGMVCLRRIVQVEGGRLVRIDTTETSLIWGEESGWAPLQQSRPRLAGGSGTATRPEPSGRLGNGSVRREYRVDRHLQQITALIDAKQFEVISHPDSGIVLIQGGAGSGKTTVALHRLAYLMSRQPQYFTSRNVLPTVFGTALAHYISKVLPSLGVEHTPARVYQEWVSHQRQQRLDHLPRNYTEHTPVAVIEFKRHPLILKWFAEEAAQRLKAFEQDLFTRAVGVAGESELRSTWAALSEEPLWPRLDRLSRWMQGNYRAPGIPDWKHPALAQRLEPLLEDHFPEREEPRRFLSEFYNDLLLNKAALQKAAETWAPGVFTPGQLESIWSWNVRQYQKRRDADNENLRDALKNVAQEHELAGVSSGMGFEEELPTLDEEDDTLLLVLHQQILGPLRRKKGKLVQFHHLMIDEAQDFSPTEFELMISLTSPKRRSVTLAGDMDQRIMEGRGHQDWQTSLGGLGHEITMLEPLKIGYRSTRQITRTARQVIGDLTVNTHWEAVREGAPVERFPFQELGALLVFLGDALEGLAIREPHASVAVLTRTPESADEIHAGLQRSDIPNLRRIRDQEFSFTAGIEVTNIAQTKGLEFDYVVIADADAGTYSTDRRSRHLLYVGVTRASHQLWLLHTGTPSPLILAETA